ncbi:MAG: hypothetical protein H3C47_09695 [Candidatus Cloacimonetes bacterium]|nr:hypothetical protein [Candidatus Cloacimonadota bacterium]
MIKNQFSFILSEVPESLNYVAIQSKQNTSHLLSQCIKRTGLNDSLTEQILLWQSWFEDRASRGIASSWK